MSQHERELRAEIRAARFGSPAETRPTPQPPSRPHQPMPRAPEGEWVTGEVVRFGAVRRCGVGPLSVEIDAPPAWNRRFELNVAAHHAMHLKTRLYVEDDLHSRTAHLIGDGESSHCSVEVQRTGRRVRVRRGDADVPVTDVGGTHVGALASSASSVATTRRVEDPPSPDERRLFVYGSPRGTARQERDIPRDPIRRGGRYRLVIYSEQPVDWSGVLFTLRERRLRVEDRHLAARDAAHERAMDAWREDLRDWQRRLANFGMTPSEYAALKAREAESAARRWERRRQLESALRAAWDACTRWSCRRALYRQYCDSDPLDTCDERQADLRHVPQHSARRASRQRVTPPPPMPLARSQPPRPSPDARWSDGTWIWDGEQYQWLDGAWVLPGETHRAVAVQAPPPRTPAEVPAPAATEPEAVWVGGHHELVDGIFSWVEGAWRLRPRRGARWVPPVIRATGEGSVFVPGGWDVRISGAAEGGQ